MGVVGCQSLNVLNFRRILSRACGLSALKSQYEQGKLDMQAKRPKSAMSISRSEGSPATVVSFSSQGQRLQFTPVAIVPPKDCSCVEAIDGFCPGTCPHPRLPPRSSSSSSSSSSRASSMYQLRKDEVEGACCCKHRLIKDKEEQEKQLRMQPSSGEADDDLELGNDD